MRQHVSLVRAAVAQHHAVFKQSSPPVVMKAEQVRVAGFPFDGHVRIGLLQFSMIEGKETFLVRAKNIRLEPEGTGYRMVLPHYLHALYAADTQPPEHYQVHIKELPELLLQPDASEVKFSGVRVVMPPKIHITMRLDAESVEADFVMPPFDGSHNYSIPENITRELWLFVSVLREGLIFKTQPTSML